MSSQDKQDGLLSRWSRRKLDPSAHKDAEDSSPVESESQDSEREAELAANREAAEAVDLSTLNKDSDLSVFMKEGVPELLKRQALAALWRSNPVFSNIDGLVDYDDDFANPDLIMKTFQSAYQAGRGYLKEIAEEEEAGESPQEVSELEADPEPDDVPDVEEADDSRELEDDQPVKPEDNVKELSAVDTGEDAEIVDPPKVSLRRRLMLDPSG